MANIEETHITPFSPIDVFEYFLHPQKVLDISDPSVGAKVVESPEKLSSGDRLVVELMAFGSVRRVVYEANVDHDELTMVETMVEGDLRAWAHTKRFTVDGTGCRVTDSIEFEPPGGMAGFLLTADKIASHVSDNIAYRNQRLAKALTEFVS